MSAATDRAIDALRKLLRLHERFSGGVWDDARAALAAADARAEAEALQERIKRADVETALAVATERQQIISLIEQSAAIYNGAYMDHADPEDLGAHIALMQMAHQLRLGDTK